jgi:type IV secretory pathway VirB10-like protein
MVKPSTLNFQGYKVMAKKPSNLLAGLTNAKTRTFVILFGAVIVIGVGIAIMRSNSETEDVLAKQGSQAVGVPPQIRATPGSVVSEQYKELQVADNKKRSDEALKKKTSAIPTIIGAVSDEDSKTNANSLESALKNQQQGTSNKLGFGQAEEGSLANAGFVGKSLREREMEEQEARIKEQRDKLEKQRIEKERREELERQRRLAEQEQKNYDASVKAVSAQMKAYSQGAYNEWTKFPVQAYVQGELASKPYKPNTPSTTIITTGGQGSGSGSATQTPTRIIGNRVVGEIRKPKQVIKAGTVLFAVLDTAVNSDEKGPILATVVSGKYSGGRVVGAFTHADYQESVIMQFSTLSLPKRTKSTSIQAVAIDPDTARTALASDVDHHYFLRYGSLFASSFISGYGKAITNQGTTTTSPLTGTTTTTTPPLDNKEKFLAALGEVGTAWAAQVKPIFNTPYTVYVDQGTGIGLLFLSDVDLSEEG